MTLKIKVKKLGLRFWFPISAAGGIAISCAKRELKKAGFTLKKSRRLKRDIVRAVKQTKKQLGGFVLVDVLTADGVKVKITV